MIDNNTKSSIDISTILGKVDHTLLSVTARWEDIRAICDDAAVYKTASVCIPPCYVKRAKEQYPSLCICTVIGFPNGYASTETKCFEASDAVRNGADEIDMVINVGMLKDGRESDVLDEINAVKAACEGRLLKVIIETCLLTEQEKLTMCKLLSQSSADYIKTSTGFSTGGATIEDVALMRANCDERIKVKAAGGISSIEDAQRFIEAGADRLGTSRIVKLVK